MNIGSSSVRERKGNKLNQQTNTTGSDHPGESSSELTEDNFFVNVNQRVGSEFSIKI